MKYTKGKWVFDEELNANFSMISGSETVICGLPNPIPCDTYRKELVEMRANANLIIAAPDMYEALRDSQELLEAQVPRFSNDPVLKKQIENNAKALAKAEEKIIMKKET